MGLQETLIRQRRIFQPDPYGWRPPQNSFPAQFLQQLLQNEQGLKEEAEAQEGGQ